MMKRGILTGLFLALALTAFGPAALAQKAPKIKDTVTFAKSWEKAVEEAKLLNLPIVVHSHGFYWGPCWGMHSAVLQNKKYVKFSNENTVEVLSLSRLDEGVQKEDPKAAKYKTKDAEGNEVEYMVSWPNLTYDEIIALNRSKAGSYNDTGGIPYTAIVNPHTLEKMTFFKGGQSSKTIMEAAEEAKKALEDAHGKGLSRDELRKNDEAIAKSKKEIADGDYDGAIQLLEKAGYGKDKTHQVIAEKLESAHGEIVTAARARFDEIKAMEPKDQKKELNRFISKNKKTGLEAEIREALLSLKDAE